MKPWIAALLLLLAACQHQAQVQKANPFPRGLWSFSAVTVVDKSDRWMTPVAVSFRQCIRYSTELPLPKPTHGCKVTDFHRHGQTYFWIKRCGQGKQLTVYKSESTFTEDSMTGFLTTERNGHISKNQYTGKRLSKDCE